MRALRAGRAKLGDRFGRQSAADDQGTRKVTNDQLSDQARGRRGTAANSGRGRIAKSRHKQLSLRMGRQIVGLSLTAVVMWGDVRLAYAYTPSAPIEGPALLCFTHSRFQLAATERVTDVSLGIHAMSIDVAGPDGKYTVSEGDHFRTPRRLGHAVFRTETLSVHRVRWYGETQYAVVGIAPNQPRALIWVSGSALAVSRSKQVFRRLTIGDPARADCDMLFRYGWNLGD
jgi:hypothetical protein